MRSSEGRVVWVRGVKVPERHHGRISRLKEHMKAAVEQRKKADSLRDAAKETDAVLSALVNSPNLKVRGGRLMSLANGRGEIPFHERSDGTRTRLACLEKLHRIRALNSDQLALIPIPQRNFADLAPSAKRELICWAVENNCCIITAEVTDGDKLTAEVVNG